MWQLCLPPEPQTILAVGSGRWSEFSFLSLLEFFQIFHLNQSTEYRDESLKIQLQVPVRLLRLLTQIHYHLSRLGRLATLKRLGLRRRSDSADDSAREKFWGERGGRQRKWTVGSGHPNDHNLGGQWFGERRAVFGEDCGGSKGGQGIEEEEEA